MSQHCWQVQLAAKMYDCMNLDFPSLKTKWRPHELSRIGGNSTCSRTPNQVPAPFMLTSRLRHMQTLLSALPRLVDLVLSGHMKLGPCSCLVATLAKPPLKTTYKSFESHGNPTVHHVSICILFFIRASAASRSCTRMTPMSMRKDQTSQACLSNLLTVTS